MDSLDPLESLMLTAELVSSPMHVAVLMILSPPAGEDPETYPRRLYEESLEASVEIDPRLRRMPHSGVDTGFGWVWRDVTDRGGTVDVRHHFQRRTLPRDSGIGDLWELVSGLHALRLDRSAPMWMVYLIDGLPDGRFAFYIKVHHIVIDGVAGMQMIAGSLSPDSERRGMPPLYSSSPTTTGGVQTVTRPGHRGGGLVSALHGIADTVTAGVGFTGRLARTELATALGALLSRSIVAPFGAPRTRFNTKLGPFRSVAGTSLERSRIRAVREAAGVTGNDVVMALIAGALRAWLQDRGELPGRSLVAICPVTVRGRGASDADRHGNQFGMGLCRLGTDLADPVERLMLVHDAMKNLKSQVAKQGPGAMLAAMAPAIGPTIALAMLPFDTRIPPSFNIPISNVPGPREQMYFNGAHVEQIYPVSTVYDGMALNITVCSYAEQMGVGYVADREVVGDIETLIPLTDRALAELERALGLTTDEPGSAT
ncbi:MAG: wax ester/triacylglycerol synthase family O-acyltransferase [Mycobacterium sp.]